MEENKNYFAFISYQRDDEEWAKWLAHELEHYHLPLTLNGQNDLPQDLRPIFRDIDELSAGNLPQQIHKALECSKHLIVICSPQSAKSPWVNKEIEEYISMGKTDKIFPFIIDGTAMCKNPDDPKECFPPALRNLPKNEERLGANVNENGHGNKLRTCNDCPIKEERIRSDKQGDINDKGRDAAVVKIVAGMLGLNFDTLWQRYEREKAEEERRIKEQRDNLLRIQSRFLAKEANECLNKHLFDKASLIALEALPINLDKPNRPYVEEADNVLRESTIDTSPIIRFHKDSCIYVNGINYAVAEEGYSISIWNTQLESCLKKIKLFDLIPYGLDSWQRKHGKFKLITFVEREESLNLIFSCDNSLYILDCLTEQVSLLYKSNLNDIIFSDIIFSPTRKHVICIATPVVSSLGICKHTFLLDMDTLECIKEISFNAPILASFSPNGKLIGFTSGHNIHIYNIASDTYPYKCRYYDVGFGSFIDDNTYVFSCSDNSLRKWSLISDEVELTYQCKSQITGIISDKDFVALCTASNDIIVIDTNLQTAIASRNWHSKIIFKSFSKDKTTLTYTDDNSLRTWNFRIRANGQYLLYYHLSPISCVAYSTDHLSFASASDECIKVWDIPQKRIIGEFSIGSSINQMVISSYNNRIIYDDYHGVWNLDCTSGELKKLAPSADKILLSPDDKLILVTYENTIFLFDTISTELYQTLKTPKDQMLFGMDIVAFSPNGDYIAALTSPEIPSLMVATLWDVKNGASLTSITFEADFGESVSFSHDGNAVIINNDLIWDYHKNQIRTIEKTIEAASLNTTNESIVYDGIFVLMERNISLQELINETRKRLKDNPLTSYERKKYYLD